MRTIVATDLDGTVIFSKRLSGSVSDLVVVDHENGRACGAMTPGAHRGWVRLARSRAVIPVTARSTSQYQRIRLPGPPSRLALVCNGARLLVDGVVDTAWERPIRRPAAGVAPFDEMRAQARRWTQGHPMVGLRSVDGFFFYLASAQPDWCGGECAGDIGAWAERQGWRVLSQGRRLYVLPTGLDKASAVGRIAERLGPVRVIAGGDSLLDEAMLRAADRSIRPAHGDLHAMGFVASHCDITRSSGVVAGEEIVRWYLRQIERVQTHHLPKEQS